MTANLKNFKTSQIHRKELTAKLQKLKAVNFYLSYHHLRYIFINAQHYYL